MIATFSPCTLSGAVDAPPSKSLAHRYLIGAALSKAPCILTGIDLSEDILASIDCLRALGADALIDKDIVSINPSGFLKSPSEALDCRESGSSLRFFIPLALCLGTPVRLKGSAGLLCRPLEVYEMLCHQRGFEFNNDGNIVSVCGRLTGGSYELRGDISSQFISGMIFALIYLNEASTITIIPPFESRSYVEMTLDALRSFGAAVSFEDKYKISIKPSRMHSYSGRLEGDYSNAAFLEAFNYLDSEVRVDKLKPDSLQGDRIYREYFDTLSKGNSIIDISNCPDLGPVLIALAAMKGGAVLTGTDRLKVKESDRGRAMHEELTKLGGGLIFGDNMITVPKQTLEYKGIPIDGHNDHRIVMAMSVILSKTGGAIDGAEAVKKSYPGFFKDIMKLGARVELK